MSITKYNILVSALDHSVGTIIRWLQGFSNGVVPNENMSTVRYSRETFWVAIGDWMDGAAA